MGPETIADLEKKPDEFALALVSILSFVVGGWVLAVVMWFVTREKSEYVRFQATQTLAFQLLEMAVVFVYAAVVTFGIFGMILLQPIDGTMESVLSIGMIILSFFHMLFVFGLLGTNLAWSTTIKIPH